jgi:hypothetical protein
MVKQTMARLLLATVAVLAAFAPGSAWAQECVAPPGTAAIDQYCETVPTTTGDRGGAGAVGGPGVSAAQLKALQAGTPEEQALARELNTRKRGTSGSKGRSGSTTAGERTGSSAGREEEVSSSPLSAIRSAVDSGATVDAAFGWALLLMTVAATGAWWVGRTRRES